LPGTRWRAIALCSVAACLAAVVYLNAIDNPFVWDDRRTVVENASIRPPLDWRAVFYHDRFRPLVNATYAADYALGGLAVGGYHRTSILLHVLNVVLLFLATRRVVGTAARGAPAPPLPKGRGRPSTAGRGGAPDRATVAAFAAAALFAAHPMLTQAVGYVSGRAEVLCAAFFLAAFLAAVSWLDTGRAVWLLAAAAAWLLALASKEVAVALPFVLGAHGLIASDFSGTARRRLLYGTAVALALMAVAATYRLATLVQVENSARAAFAWSNVLLGLDTMRRYAMMMVVPAGQSVFHTAQLAKVTAPAVVVLNAAVIVALAAGAWTARRVERAAAFGLAWFLLLLVPSTLLLVLDVGEPMAEQRVYLAACGLAIAFGAGYARLDAWLGGGSRLAARLGLVALVGLLAVLAVGRNRVWHDPVVLWSEAVAREPRAWVPYFGLGDALRERGDYARAAEAYGEAVRLRPEEPRTYVPLATSLLMSGRPGDADKYFERAEQLGAGGLEAPVGRALAARMAGRRDEARDRLEAIARARADAVLPRQILAEIYERDYGDRASALRACLEVRALAPNTPGVDDCVRRNQQP
jgi:protein O-mannosyl-transferase